VFRGVSWARGLRRWWLICGDDAQADLGSRERPHLGAVNLRSSSSPAIAHHKITPHRSVCSLIVRHSVKSYDFYLDYYADPATSGHQLGQELSVHATSPHCLLSSSRYCSGSLSEHLIDLFSLTFPVDRWTLRCLWPGKTEVRKDTCRSASITFERRLRGTSSQEATPGLFKPQPLASSQ
jgi:hypothetical protein